MRHKKSIDMSKKTQVDKKRTYQDIRTELYRSEQRFRDIAEVASDWFWETDSDHRFTYISDKFYEVSSIHPKEVIGKTRLEFISDCELKTNPKKWKDHEATLLNRRPFRNLEYQVDTPDGKPCYIRISGKAFFSEDDIFLGYRGAGSDITAQKVAECEQVESALRASEYEYRLTLNDLRIGVVVHAGDTSILLSNPEATNILGLTFEQMSGKKAIDPAWNFVHEDLSIMKVGDYPVNKVLSTKKPLHDYVLGIIRRDRDYITWVIVNASPVFSVDDELEKVVVNFVDITARMQAEDALRQSKERLESIVNNAVMGIYQVTHEGKFLLVNYRFARMFGYKSPEEFLASVENISQLYVHPEERASVIEKIKTKNFLDDVVIRFRNRDGEIVLARVSVRVIEDQTKRIIYEGFMADITEQRRVEEALRESEEKLARSKKMESLGLLAGGVAHDLNNVLAGIVSYPELLLLDLPEDSHIRKAIETIKESGDRAVAIVQDLLTVARGVATTKEPLNLNDLIADYLHSPEFNKLRQFHPTVTVKTSLDTNLLHIGGSYVHIGKVVMNLVSNASEAIRSSGNVSISTANRYVDKPLRGYDDITPGEYAVLAVSDDGSGISSDDLERIFEPFYTKKVMGRSGTGLGLAVVWNVVHDHKGYIDVNSNENGTTFELYFPITREKILSKNLSIPFKDLKGDAQKIMIIDDEKSQRDISCKMLNKLGYITKSVSSGEEAIEYLKKNTVDLLLLDMIMDPGIDGCETYERVIEIHPNQKAIIVSGFAETETVKKAQKLGAGKYIKKPLTLEKIGMGVKDELEKK